jgi:hypothetical protein
MNFTTATNSYNVAVGYDAGNDITTGTNNVIIGGLAGDALTDADFNVAVGQSALGADTKGSRSTAVGYQALVNQNLTTATDTYNVALGAAAGFATTTGNQNTLLGANAGDAITTGGGNTIVGYNNDVPAVGNNFSIIMGTGVTGVGGDNFTFGRGTLDSNIAFGGTSITAPSDERYKESIADSTAGLSFINDLRPVTFQWKKEKDIPSDHRAYVEGSDNRVINDYTNHGFIAQEVKAAIDNHAELKDGFDMWSEDPIDGRQRLGPAALIPMLVKAIQELSAEIETLKSGG